MTARISAAQTLADYLTADQDSDSLVTGPWGRVGQCLRRFHDAGVRHADLNARNILLDEGLQVFLIDFDRAGFTPDKAVNGTNNLNRLRRSLAKLWPTEHRSVLQPAWTLLKAGYDG